MNVTSVCLSLNEYHECVYLLMNITSVCLSLDVYHECVFSIPSTLSYKKTCFISVDKNKLSIMLKLYHLSDSLSHMTCTDRVYITFLLVQVMWYHLGADRH